MASRSTECLIRSMSTPISLPLVTVERRLMNHPWIAEVDVRRHLPNRLAVRITERLAEQDAVVQKA